MKTAPDPIVVLYVEDDPLTLRSVSDRLRRNGVRVMPADSGERALTLIGDHPALAAALLDLQLPGMDGLETYARLRQAYPELPVVVCSAHLEGPLRQRLLAMGVPTHCQLRKPCPFGDLLAAIINVTGPPKSGEPTVPDDGLRQ
jgi:CheY-like chemotaxis protein